MFNKGRVHALTLKKKSFFDEETEPSWTLRRPSLLPHPSDLVEPWFHKDDNNKDMEDNKTKRFADIWHTPSEEGDAKWIAVHQRFEQRRLSLRPPTVSLLEKYVCPCKERGFYAVY